MLELVDRHDSGSCVLLGVEVQVLFRAEWVPSFLRIGGIINGWKVSCGAPISTWGRLMFCF